MKQQNVPEGFYNLPPSGDLLAEVDRLKERADVFNSFIGDLMGRMERAEKALAALQPSSREFLAD